MQIIVSPAEIAKIIGVSGQPLNVPDVLLRAVSLLKNTINQTWQMAHSDLSSDKENLSGNASQVYKEEQQKAI